METIGINGVPTRELMAIDFNNCDWFLKGKRNIIRILCQKGGVVNYLTVHPAKIRYHVKTLFIR